jgi:3-oxoacyl-[acyl-carrier-protein] synthase-3
VFRFATRVMADATRKVLAKADLSVDDVDLVIPHQANERIIAVSMKNLKLPPEKIFINLQHYGNTSTASIPIALCEAIEQNRVKTDDNIVMVGFGAGLTWAGAAIRWGVPTEKETSFWRSSQRSASYGLARARSQWLRLTHMLGSNLVTEEGDTLPQAFAKWLEERRKQEDADAAQADQDRPEEGKGDADAGSA